MNCLILTYTQIHQLLDSRNDRILFLVVRRSWLRC